MAKDDDFQISSSIPAGNLVAAKTSTLKKQKKGNETVSVAQERLNKILEQEKQEEKEAKLKAIREKEMAKIRAAISDSEDSFTQRT